VFISIIININENFVTGCYISRSPFVKYKTTIQTANQLGDASYSWNEVSSFFCDTSCAALRDAMLCPWVMTL
jgi:hypothetical protein